jgi:hypothetical protein
MVGGCGGTQFGCCDDKVTGREDEAGTNCPEDTMALMAEMCPTELETCLAAEKCATALKASLAEQDQTMPTAEELAAVGPEAEALSACYVDKMFSDPAMLDMMTAGINSLVLGCRMESGLMGAEEMACMGACASDQEIMAPMMACMTDAGEDPAALMACGAEMTACTNACTDVGGRARRGVSCEGLAAMLSELPPVCNRQRREGHTVAVCAAIDSATALLADLPVADVGSSNVHGAHF